jgi:hypothetical protein
MAESETLHTAEEMEGVVGEASYTEGSWASSRDTVEGSVASECFVQVGSLLL